LVLQNINSGARENLEFKVSIIMHHCDVRHSIRIRAELCVSIMDFSRQLELHIVKYVYNIVKQACNILETNGGLINVLSHYFDSLFNQK